MKDFIRFGIQMGFLGGALFVCGIVAYGLATAKGDASVEEAKVDLGPLVWATTVKRSSFDEPIVGYGTARVPKVYGIRCQVSGEASFVSKNFIAGRIVQKDEVLIRIDPKDLELALAEAEANLAQLQATIDRLETDYPPIDAAIEALAQDEKDQERLLATRQAAVDLQQKEVDRLRNLVAKGGVPQSALEAAQGVLNTHDQAVVASTSRLAQIPIEIKAKGAQKRAIDAQKKVLEAQRKVIEAQIDRQRHQITKTTISAPVRGAIVLREPSTGAVVKPLSAGDVVQPGFDLGWIMPTDEGMEVPCSLDIQTARWIRLEGANIDINELLKGESAFDPELMRKILPEVKIHWYSDERYRWEGKADRFLAELDVATRSTTIVVHVDDPKFGKLSETEMPLAPGMYCAVEIPSRVQPDAIVIERSALREGNNVYLARSGELAIQPIVVSRMTKDKIVVLEGLKPGDVLITSDIPQAAPGMKVQPQIR